MAFESEQNLTREIFLLAKLFAFESDIFNNKKGASIDRYSKIFKLDQTLLTVLALKLISNQMKSKPWISLLLSFSNFKIPIST